MSSKNYVEEIRIRNVHKKLHSDLTNIAKHEGPPLSQFLRGKLREIADSYPDHYKEPMPDYDD